mgnify:CR=1 FL=1
MKNCLNARAVCIAFALFALLANPVSAKPTKAIERGMTKEQVTAIYGRPLTSSFNETTETWQYEKSRGGLLDSRLVQITIRFDTDGKVASYDEKIKTPEPQISPSSSSSASTVYNMGYGRSARCLSPEAFDILYNKVKKASFDSGKLDLIEVASLGGYFSCSQCAKLLSAFSFTDGKMKALRFVAPHVTDLQNAADIYSQFTFATDRDKAAEVIKNARR